MQLSHGLSHAQIDPFVSTGKKKKKKKKKKQNAGTIAFVGSNHVKQENLSSPLMVKHE